MTGPLRRCLSVFSLVSRIPLRLQLEPDLSRSEFWLPLMGIPASLAAIPGLLLFTVLFGDPLLAALGGLFFEYYLFNVFHLDGLLDTADAFTGQATADRRLAILKDSRIGSYAFFFGFFALAGSAAGLASLLRISTLSALAALLAAPVAGRGGCALVPLLLKPAKSEGLGVLMHGYKLRRLAAGWLAGSAPLGIAALLCGRAGLWLCAAGASLIGAGASGLLLSRLYRKGVGGFTGDALGAAVITGELICILALLAFVRVIPI